MSSERRARLQARRERMHVFRSRINASHEPPTSAEASAVDPVESVSADSGPSMDWLTETERRDVTYRVQNLMRPYREMTKWAYSKKWRGFEEKEIQGVLEARGQRSDGEGRGWSEAWVESRDRTAQWIRLPRDMSEITDSFERRQDPDRFRDFADDHGSRFLRAGKDRRLKSIVVAKNRERARERGQLDSRPDTRHTKLPIRFKRSRDEIYVYAVERRRLLAEQHPSSSLLPGLSFPGGFTVDEVYWLATQLSRRPDCRFSAVERSLMSDASPEERKRAQTINERPQLDLVVVASDLCCAERDLANPPQEPTRTPPSSSLLSHEKSLEERMRALKSTQHSGDGL